MISFNRNTKGEGKKFGKANSPSRKSNVKKSLRKSEQKRIKDLQSKERVIFEERTRLHEETVKNQKVS